MNRMRTYIFFVLFSAVNKNNTQSDVIYVMAVPGSSECMLRSVMSAARHCLHT